MLMNALLLPSCSNSGCVLDLEEIQLDLLMLVVDIFHDLLYFMEAIVRGRRGGFFLLSGFVRS